MQWRGSFALVGVVICTLGCGTTRQSDTQRTATEQLLISNAVDQAVSQIDFQPLAGKSVFFDPQYLENTVDKGYVISSLRQQLLANGCTLQEERIRATYVVEVRSGGIGTDRHSVLVGIPEMSVPALVPGQPSHIPEVPFAKKSDQNGVAKLAVFAFNRRTGKPYWQSGVVESISNAHDTWLLGAGPFRKGTLHERTEFAGRPLSPLVEDDDKDRKSTTKTAPVTEAASWPETKEPGLAEHFAALFGGSAGDVQSMKDWFHSYLAPPANAPAEPVTAQGSPPPR